MKNNFKKMAYMLLAIVLVVVSNVLVIKPLLEKDDDSSIIQTKKSEPTFLEKELVLQSNLYSKMALKNVEGKEKSQEWYQVIVRSDAIVKFQYYNKKNDVYKLNIKINDITIENDEEFYEYDKFKINFHLYGDILVLEHVRSYDHISYIKIIDLTTNTMRNLPVSEDFYINNTIIDEYGVTAELSRLTSKLDYYIEKEETLLTLRVGNTNASINVCNKTTWPEDLKNIEYVSFDINYPFVDGTINFDDPDINNFKNLEEFIKTRQKDFNNICKNNN